MMGNLKEKIYGFAVRKNEMVRYEYETYVQQNLSEHYENRTKHWKLLLKLNWHYRVLKKTTPCLVDEPSAKKNIDKKVESKGSSVVPEKNKIAQPVKASQAGMAVKGVYVNGPESELSNRVKPFHFALDLLKYDVISFDIFDTLLFRPFHNPTDVFSIIGKRLNFPAIFIGFKQARIEAEREARGVQEKEYGNREINIYEIYELMEKKYCIPVNQGVIAEIDAEKDYLMANPYMQVVFNILRAQGKTVVLTSDMYIPADIMATILEKCGYQGYDKLYVSCDYRCNKASGELFRRVKKDYSGKRIVHVGDNPVSDIKGAQKAGVDSRYYKNVNEIGKELRADWISNLTMSAYSGLVNAYLHNGLNRPPFFYEYGFVYGGIYVFGFCNWLEQKAKKEGIDKIIFLSRDGDIYQKMYNKYFGNVSNDYVYWSRFINIKYLIEMQQDAFIDRVIKQKALSVLDVELSSVFKSFSIQIEENELRKYGLALDSIITRANMESIKLCIKANWENIVAGFENERALAIGEIKTILGGAKRVAVIDVGWTGSGPVGFKAFVEQYITKECEIKCWMAGGVEHYGAKEDVLPDYMDESMDAYLFSPVHNKRNEQIHIKENVAVNNNAVFELFTQAQYPSYRGRTTNGGHEFDIPENENFQIIGEIQKGISDFCELYYKTFSKDSYLYNIAGFDAYRPFAKLAFHKSYFEKNFTDIVFGYGLSGDQNHQCIETIGSRMENYYAHNGGRK